MKETNEENLIDRCLYISCENCEYYDKEMKEKYNFEPCSAIPIIFKQKYKEEMTQKNTEGFTLNITYGEIAEYIIEMEKIKRMKEILS